jgi:hypothetical protein
MMLRENYQVAAMAALFLPRVINYDLSSIYKGRIHPWEYL